MRRPRCRGARPPACPLCRSWLVPERHGLPTVSASMERVGGTGGVRPNFPWVSGLALPELPLIDARAGRGRTPPSELALPPFDPALHDRLSFPQLPLTRRLGVAR